MRKRINIHFRILDAVTFVKDRNTSAILVCGDYPEHDDRSLYDGHTQSFLYQVLFDHHAVQANGKQQGQKDERVVVLNEFKHDQYPRRSS